MTDLPAAADLVTTAWFGLAAGLAVAVPLGPVGLLIVDRGMRHGRDVGLAAAAGVAATDLAYALLAVTATAWAARVVEPVTRPAAYLAACVIAAIGVRELLRLRRTASGPDRPATTAGGSRPTRTLLAFAALTAINPATVLYFTALSIALADRLASWPARLVFVGAVGVSSLAWQAALAGVGARLGRRPRPRLQRRSRQLGSALLLVLAALLAVNAG